jgi:hypothetical protein
MSERPTWVSSITLMVIKPQLRLLGLCPRVHNGSLDFGQPLFRRHSGKASRDTGTQRIEAILHLVAHFAQILPEVDGIGFSNHDLSIEMVMLGIVRDRQLPGNPFIEFFKPPVSS